MVENVIRARLCGRKFDGLGYLKKGGWWGVVGRSCGGLKKKLGTELIESVDIRCRDGIMENGEDEEED